MKDGEFIMSEAAKHLIEQMKSGAGPAMPDGEERPVWRVHAGLPAELKQEPVPWWEWGEEPTDQLSRLELIGGLVWLMDELAEGKGGMHLPGIDDLHSWEDHGFNLSHIEHAGGVGLRADWRFTRDRESLHVVLVIDSDGRNLWYHAEGYGNLL